ncbi:alcohol acetyltransferase [Cubamyces lactineus]|nr:alcohol acetyltransferase [Cubamyces lactineus]
MSLREAGRFEQYFYARVRLGLLLWVTVTAKYHHEAGVSLDKPTLFAALEQVVYAHPVLACRLQATGTSHTTPPAWVRLPSVDLNRLVEFRDEEPAQLEDVLETLYAAPAPSADDVPPWKLLVLQNGTLVFAYEHTIGDGQSGMTFHATLLSALRQASLSPAADHSGILSNFPTDVALTPPLEDCMDVSVPLTMLVRELSKGLLPTWLRKEAMAWTGNPVPDAPTYGMSVHLLHYSPKETKHLLQLSRSHNTTLTGILHTLALMVLSRLIRKLPDAAEYISVPMSVPISLRRYTNTPPVAFCNHVSAYSAVYPLLTADKTSNATTSAENFPWDLAADLSATLQREAPYSCRTIGLLKYLSGKYDEYLLGKLGKKRDSALELSNVGSFPKVAKAQPEGSSVRTDGPWKIEEVYFAQANPTLGMALTVNVAGAESGGLGVSVCWSKTSLDEAFGQEFLQGYKAGLRDLLDSRPS